MAFGTTKCHSGYGPKRFWLHTCTKDHPAALPNYLKAGFAVYKEETKEGE